MKIIVCILSAFSICANIAFGQATVVFDATPSIGEIQYSINGVVTPFPRGNPATLGGFGQLNIAFMAAPNGTPLTLLPDGQPDFTSAWTEAAQVAADVAPIPGAISFTPIILPASAGTPGSYDELSIVAWTGSATNWQQAIDGDATMIGWTGSSLSGGALEWSQLTGETPSVPMPVERGSDAFDGLVLSPAIPDGSQTILLLGFAFIGLAFFHRRIQGACRLAPAVANGHQRPSRTN